MATATEPALYLQPDRTHLTNSRRLQWDRISTAPGWPSAVDHLMIQLEDTDSRKRARKPADKERVRSALEAMVLDLFGSAKSDPKQWLAYSRDKNFYREAWRYVPQGVTSTAAATVADFLSRAGLADHKRGSYNKALGTGYRSRIRATHKLVTMLEGQFAMRPDTLGYAEWAELVRLKSAAEYWGGPKKLIPYKDTPETCAMRDQLRLINSFIASFRIDLEGGAASSVGSAQQNEEVHADKNDRTATRLYRVFNNGSFDHGGRFYGAWWQVISKLDRPRILIDGEATVELDYGTFHPRLCYHLEGQPLPPDRDPYAVEGVSRAECRDMIKTAFNQLINITGEKDPRPPKGATKLLPRGVSYRKLAALIEEGNQPIRHWFRSGRGVELQRIDSDIAASIMVRLMDQGVCCLPVHDSFIVPASEETSLRTAMKEEYRSRLLAITGKAFDPVIPG